MKKQLLIVVMIVTLHANLTVMHYVKCKHFIFVNWQLHAQVHYIFPFT
jgi:hypothetical protein